MRKILNNELTLSQMKYILVIGDHNGLSINDISSKLQITKQSVSRMVSKLSSLLLVNKCKKSNVLSSEGRKVYDKYRKYVDKLISIFDQKNIEDSKNKSIGLLFILNEDDINKLFIV